jgi:flavin-dependent dehydrogenase
MATIKILVGIYNMFDVIVLGGGIGGLYSAYSVLKKHPGASVLVLEKES